MPKKFTGQNSKAVVAKERKQNAKDTQKKQDQAALEEAYWKEDDKHVLKKQQRKEKEEAKRQEQLQKKADAKALLEAEMNSIKTTTKPAPTQKLTRAQIGNISTTTGASTAVTKESKKTEVEEPAPLIENLNRLELDQEDARTVEEAITILTDKVEDADKHPEKRMRAAHLAYEEKRLKELKLEHPSLRLSQLKDMVFREWQTHPDNPRNKAFLAKK